MTQNNPQHAFITGAARRLGRSMATHLHKQGWRITVHFHDSEKEAQSLRDQIGCSLFRADFATIPMEFLQQRLEMEVGDVDVLINNASSFQRATWDVVTEALWDSEMSVNLKSPFFLMQHFGKRMKRTGHGKIINMADIAAERAYMPYLPYSLAKSALVAATRGFARALAPHVQVNAIAPGTVLFPEDVSAESQNKLLKKIPAGRTATVDEFLRTVDFLLSDVDYITGQILNLDGGRSLTW